MNIRLGRILSMMFRLLIISTKLFAMEQESGTADDNTFVLTRTTKVLSTQYFRIGLFLPSSQEQVGHLAFYINTKTKRSGITYLSINEAHRRQGHATTLLTHIFEHFKSVPGVTQVFLNVQLSNQPARALYTKHGFTPVEDLKKDYDSDPNIAIELVKNLYD